MRCRLLLALLVLVTMQVAFMAPVLARPARVSLHYRNADVVYVLKQIARAMQMNLVTDRTVTGTVTLDLTNVPAHAALKLVTAVHGTGYKVLGNTIVVGSEETLSRIPDDLMRPEK